MQTNLRVNNQPTFNARVSDNFIKAAHNYLNGVEYRPSKTKFFDKKVAQVFNEFGYDEFTIKYAKENKDGKLTHKLYAEKEGLSVPLTEKDQFRKVIEKFQRMTKGELYVKIKQFRQEHPELKKLNANIEMPELK